MSSSPAAPAVFAELAAIGRRFYARDWVLGTSGNFSAVVELDPFRLAITPSAAHKGTLSAHDFLEVDGEGRPAKGVTATPSAEVRLHLEVVRARGALAVLHTHSVWGTILSDLYAGDRGFAIHGYEMLKGLYGVRSHDHREWIPIVENDQDMIRLAADVRGELAGHPAAHAFLLRGHGLYTWGQSLAEAERHVEILEFLFEVVGRRTLRPS
jgi:methylthioribulose-1-phosphate dehydratase